MGNEGTLSKEEVLDELIDKLSAEGFSPVTIFLVIPAVIQFLEDGYGATIIRDTGKCRVILVEDKTVTISPISEKDFEKILERSRQK